MSSSDFWNNKETAQTQVEEVSRLRSKLLPLQKLEARLADLPLLLELANE